MNAARGAIARFVNDLLEMNDELFLYRFSNYPVLVQGWTHDRRDLLDPLARLVAQWRDGDVRRGRESRSRSRSRARTARRRSS